MAVVENLNPKKYLIILGKYVKFLTGQGMWMG